MGYPIFGKVKNIVLPTPNNEFITLRQYKDLYGIDLVELLGLVLADDGTFTIDSNRLNFSIYLKVYGSASTLHPMFVQVSSVHYANRTEDQSSYVGLTIGEERTNDKLLIVLPYDKDIDIDNVLVGFADSYD